MSKPSWPPLTGPRSWTCCTIYTPHTKTTRRSFTLALAWARTCWSPTRKPSIAGSGLTRFATRTRPSAKRSRPSPITRRLWATPRDSPNCWFSTASKQLDTVRISVDQEEGFFEALVRMFEQALQSAKTLPADGRDSLIVRLNRVREISHAFGYGVGDDMDYLWTKYAKQSR